MIFQKYYNINNLSEGRSCSEGLILIDILLAMSLGVLFIVLITQSSFNSREIFESAKERSRLLDVYEAHANEFEGMMPYESRDIILNADGLDFPTTTISAYAHWYGNDRIQTDMTISSGQTSSNIERMPYLQSLTFNSVRAYPFYDLNDLASTPLCSVDFSNKDLVGSYGFSQKNSMSSRFLIQPDPQSLNPNIIPIILPINSSLPLTDFEVRNGRAYISTDSSKSLDPDILIVDIHDPPHANLTAGINMGPGVASIALVGDRIFAAATSRTAQLQAIRALSTDNMIIESNYRLPLPYATATPALGSSVFYNRGYIYLGTEKWDGEEFNIVDVSDPSHPMRLGGLETGSKINDIFVRSGVAYIAASDEKQLRIIDVHDPMNPSLLDSFSSSGWERQEGKELSFFEDTFDFGRTSGGFDIKQDHELFEWGTSTITRIQSIQSGNSLNTPIPDSVDITGGVYGIVADRSFVYVATRQPGREFQIFDHNLSTTTVRVISLPVAPQAMTCDGDKLYILGAIAPVIYQISFR